MLRLRSVSSLRSKLQRLGSVGPEAKPSSFVPPVAPEPPVPPAERAQMLERLRLKIAHIVAKQAPAPPPPADPSGGELPFVAEDTPAGRLYVRHVLFEPHHRVGRFPLHTGRGADAHMLSLLALDPSLASTDMANALYLDTETTGLSGGTGTLPFLIGLGLFQPEGRLLVEQLLLRRPGEETPILERVRARVEACSVLVTFNGKAFDMPLVRTRFVMNRMAALPERRHLDLLHVARRVHRTRIGGCRLGSIESHVLGFGRVNDVPSGEVSARYAHFLRTGDEGALLGVVEHNVWDVVSMAALAGLYGEPLDGMAAEDLVGVAATLQRARSLERAAAFADEAVARGGGGVALQARAMVAKSRGDRAQALVDLEAAICEVDDPCVRLELAKLYEHHCKAPGAALACVEQGVAEKPDAAARRRARLQRKLVRQEQVNSATPVGRRRPTRVNPAQAPLPGVGEPRSQA